jgi:hypothetical protein
VRIEGQIEAELLLVESQAASLIPDVNVDRVNSQVGAVAIHILTGHVPSRRCGGATHASSL